MARSHSASVRRHKSALRAAVALFTTMSSRPNSSSACATMAAAPSHVAEPVSGTARPPAAEISPATEAASAPVRRPVSFTSTEAPSAARRRACSRPMPPPAPVTIATRPSSLPAMCPPSILFGRGAG